MAAYADDVLFSLTNPATSLPNLMREFVDYRRISNLKINLGKSVAMGVGIPGPRLAHLRSSFGLQWTDTAPTYLGTRIYPRPSPKFLN